MGHEVTVMGDGQACFDRFKADTKYFDVVLMDLQVTSSALLNITLGH